MSRSSYDQQLQRLFDTSQEDYNAPPWPATQAPQFRTRYDSMEQKHWCPNCRENFEPLTGFRTKYDLALQQHWCPKCNGGSPSPPLGKFSYACSPGLGCHLLQQAPGSGPSGVRYSNKQACEAKCAKPPHPSPPLGKFSYACSPGLGCHLLQQAPGSGPSGVRYSNKQACEAKCAKPPGKHNWCTGLQHSECDQRHPACVWTPGGSSGGGSCGMSRP